MKFRVQGLEFRVQGSEFNALGILSIVSLGNHSLATLNSEPLNSERWTLNPEL
jgi:hypothetical protein